MKLVKYFWILSFIYYFNALAGHFPINPGFSNSDDRHPSKDYWYQKSRLFADLMSKKLLFLKPNSNKTGVGEHDNVRDLVDSNINPLFRSVIEIHEKGLSSSHLELDYWTGYFW